MHHRDMTVCHLLSGEAGEPVHGGTAEPWRYGWRVRPRVSCPKELTGRDYLPLSDQIVEFTRSLDSTHGIVHAPSFVLMTPQNNIVMMSSM
jgi:hypothetical protein